MTVSALTACMPQLSRNDFKHDSALYAYFNQKSGASQQTPGALVADNNILWEAPASARGCVREKLIADRVQHRYAAPINDIVRGCHSEPDASLVVAGISGGGHKSEVFALSVMEELDQYYGLLDDIDAIASASGGSFAALIYALSCDEGTCEGADSWRWIWQPDVDMNSIDNLKEQNYLWPFFLTRLRPDHLFLNATTYHDSGESFVDVLSGRMFENKPDVSFNDLNHNRPNLFLTATNITRNRESLLDPNSTVSSEKPAIEMHQRSSAQHFSFTQGYFDALDSDLGTYSVVRALVASAAFPLIVDPTTVRNYKNDGGPGCKNWYPSSDCESFVHLTDGGVHDNVAISELQWFVECTFADLLTVRPRAGTLQPFCNKQVFRNRGRPKVVLSITIDASLTASDGRDNQKAEQRLSSYGIPIRIGSTSDIVSMMSFSNTTQRKSDLAALSQELNADNTRTVAAFADFGLETLGDLKCIEEQDCKSWQGVRKFAEAHGRRDLDEPKHSYMRELYDRVRNVDVSFELSEADRRALAEAAPWIVARRVLQLCDEEIIQSMFEPSEAAKICNTGGREAAE